MKCPIRITKRWVSSAGLGFVLAILAGCSFDDGGGSDQPNRLQGAITQGDGIPLASGRVRLYSGTYNRGFDIGVEPGHGKLESETQTDQRGRFALKLSKGDHFLEIFNADSNKIWIQDSISNNSPKIDLGVINVAEAASLNGIVVSSQPVEAMLIAGTHFQAIPEPSGKFTFPLLPPGEFRLVAKMGASAGKQLIPAEVITLEPGSKLNLDSIFVEANEILMFNFDTVEDFSRLRGLTFPFTQASSSYYGGWWPRPQTIAGKGAFRNKSLFTKIKEGQGIGFSMGTGYQDLSKMTAFSFWAKGAGTLNVAFHSKLIPNLGPTFYSKVILTDSTTWIQYRILASQIVSGGAETHNYTWERGKTAVGKITIRSPLVDMEIGLDEIRLEGLTYKDLGPVLNPGTNDALP